MAFNINGDFKMLNAAGRVTKSRSGFEPVEGYVLEDRIARAQRKIRSLNSAIRDMQALLDAGDNA